METRRATGLIWEASAGIGTINPSVIQTATPGTRLPTEGPLNHKTVPFLQTGWAGNSRWTKSDLNLASFPASIHFKPLQGAKGRNLQTCFCFNCVSLHLFNFSKGEVIWTNIGMACHCFKIYFFFLCQRNMHNKRKQFVTGRKNKYFRSTPSLAHNGNWILLELGISWHPKISHTGKGGGFPPRPDND